MAVVVRWVEPGDIPHVLSERVDNGGDERFSLTTYAEESSQATSELVIRDPTGDLAITRLNRCDVAETDSISDDPYIFVGRFWTITEQRGRYRTAAGRDQVCEVQDLNTIASNYIVDETDDGDRPAEDHSDRVAWAASKIPNVADTSLVIIDTAKDMPAYDYEGMSWQQVLEDCARASGYQHFIWYNGETDEIGVVYAQTGGDWLVSPIRVSNVIADVQGDGTGMTFYGGELKLSHDPSRVASRVYARGDSIAVTRRNTATEIARARRDVAMDFPTVKNIATLSSRADRALANDLDTDTDVLKGWVLLPSTHASMFKAGYRFDCHATHLTGYQADFASARLLITTHTMVTPTLYRVDFEAEPIAVVVDTVNCENDLNQPFGTVTDGGSSPPGGYGNPSNPSYVNDGDDNTRSGYNTGYVGGQTFARWKSDLGTARDVSGFVLLTDWACSADPDSYTTFQYSDNGTDWTECPATMTSSVSEGVPWRAIWEIDAGTISHRYWRVTFSANGGGGYHCLGWLYTWCIVGTG